MQTSLQTTRPSMGAFKASGVPAARRSTLVVRAQANTDFVQNMGKAAVVLAAGLALTLAPPADAKVAGKLTKFEKNQVYQAELLESIKARTGKTEVLPSLTSRPADVDPPAFVRAPLKFADAIQQTKAEAPASTPTPLPSVSATVTPPKPPAAAAADISDYLSSSFSTPVATKAAPAAPPAAVAPVEGGDNKGLLAVGGIAVLLGAAAIASNSNSEGGDMQSAPAAATAGASAGASNIPPNVASARAWIGAWKKKHGKA